MFRVLEMARNEETMKANFTKNISNIVYTTSPLYVIQKQFGISTFQIINGEIQPTHWKMKILGSFGAFTCIT